VDKKVVVEKVDGIYTDNVVAYDARLKKCASTDCWGLNFSVSDSVKLPDYRTHVFPLYENTEMTDDERSALVREGIRFDVTARRIVDPGERLKGKVLVTQGTYRHVGSALAEGRPALYNKKKREVREEQKRQREENARLMDRGDEKVKGKPVRSRAKANTAMIKTAAMGLMYKGRLQKRPDQPWKAEDGNPAWRFEVMTKGIAGMDTNRQYKVTIKRVCECTCKEYEAMLRRKGPFVWCKHIYAIMQKVLKFKASDALMRQVAFNLAELKEIFERQPDLKGLE
jgi:hypothetical protein